jgi:hypothetical protein
LLLLKALLSAAAMLLNGIEYGAWILSSLVLFATAIQLWRNGRIHNRRVFFVYLLVVGVHGLINLFLSLTNPVWWFYSFYLGAFITTLLGFVVLFEVAKAALSVPVFRLNSSTFFSLCAVGAVIAVIVSANTRFDGPSFMKVRLLLEVSLRIMQISILAIFAAVSVLFGLFWRRLEFGIVLGYGFYAASQLAVIFLRASVGDAAHKVFVLMPNVCFLCASVIWLVYSSVSDSTVALAAREEVASKVYDASTAVERLR